MKTHYKTFILLGAAAAILLWTGLVSRSSQAYTISTRLGAACHERITSEALRTVRLEFATAAPLPLTDDEQALVDDLEFSPDQDMMDLGGVALLVGVRDNDLKGNASDDLTELAGVAGDPDTQEEHCLRNKDQDEPGGSESAVKACRKFIRGRVAEALDGLDASGMPDINTRTSVYVHLALRGGVHAPLPTYYVRMGQAIHAAEDGFTHTYRTADGMKITVVLNWVDEADGTLTESRDGPAHAGALDVCSDPDDLRKKRRELATAVATALLHATLNPKNTRGEKMAAVDATLDRYFTYMPGCTFANHWCNAPERSYADTALSRFGCATVSVGNDSPGDAFLGGIGALAGLMLLLLRRKTTTSIVAAFMVAGTIALAAGNAHAAKPGKPPAGTTGEPAEADTHAPPFPVIVPVPQPGPVDPSEGAWGAYLGFSGSVDKPAIAGQVGLRRRVSTHWTFGWDVEWNPWISVSGATPVRAGVFNTYGTAILRFPLAYENFNLRTTASLGISDLLIDLYGASKGSIGLYGALYPLGLEWKLSRWFLLIINPIGIAVPMPQVQAVPLMYPQYRSSIGIGILAG